MLSAIFSNKNNRLQTSGARAAKVICAGAILLVTGLMLVNECLGDKKGEKRIKVTHVALDQEGKPIAGGKSPLEIRETTDGILLVVHGDEVASVPETDPENFLAYPLEKDAPPAVRVVNKAERGCYWTKISIDLKGRKSPDESRIGESAEYFTPKEGPGVGSYLVVNKKTRRVMLVEQQKMGAFGDYFYVSRSASYDNLDDGK